MDHFWQDLRHGLRTMRAHPGFTAVAVLTIALGIAANTAIFSAVNALLLRPLPVRDVDRLVFGMALREGTDPFGTSMLDYASYREQARSFANVGLATRRQFALIGADEPQHLNGAAVTASYLATLGVEPELGRLFTAEEDQPGGPPLVLISHALWEQRFGGSRSALGRSILLDGQPHTIVGVLPAGFDIPYTAETWVPMQTAFDSLSLNERAATAHELVARLRPGVTLERADAEMKSLARTLEQQYPHVRRGWTYGLVPLRRELLDLHPQAARDDEQVSLRTHRQRAARVRVRVRHGRFATFIQFHHFAAVVLRQQQTAVIGADDAVAVVAGLLPEERPLLARSDHP